MPDSLTRIFSGLISRWMICITTKIASQCHAIEESEKRSRNDNVNSKSVETWLRVGPQLPTFTQFNWHHNNITTTPRHTCRRIASRPVRVRVIRDRVRYRGAILRPVGGTVALRQDPNASKGPHAPGGGKFWSRFAFTVYIARNLVSWFSGKSLKLLPPDVRF